MAIITILLLLLFRSRPPLGAEEARATRPVLPPAPAPLQLRKMEPSAYEQERLANIARNNAKLTELGLKDDELIRTSKPQIKKRPRESKPVAAPTRASGRLSGAVVEELHGANDAIDALEEKLSYADPLKRASKAPRLTAEQCTKLNSLEDVSAEPLSKQELAALVLTRDDLINERTEGGWRAHKSKGTNMYAEKRQILQQAAKRHGLRWPSWLGKIQAALPPMGTTDTARDQTMYSIERAGTHEGPPNPATRPSPLLLCCA